MTTARVWAAAFLFAAAAAPQARSEDEVLDPARWRIAMDAGYSAELVPAPQNPKALRATLERPDPSTGPFSPGAVRILYQGFQVTADQPLLVGFRARADRPRTVQLSLLQGRSPWQPLAPEQQFQITPEWTSYSARLVPAKDDVAQFKFSIGSSDAPFEFAEFVLRRDAGEGNGDLHAASWRLRASQGAAAVLGRSPAGAETIRVETKTPSPSKTFWHVSLVHPGLSIEEGTRYILSFRARADSVRTVQCLLMDATPPRGNLGLLREITLTPEWKTFGFRVRPSATSNNAEVVLNLGNDPSAVEFTDARFQRGHPVRDGVLDPADWKVSSFGASRGELTFSPESPDILRVEFPALDQARIPWHVALIHPGLSFDEGSQYKLSFRARARKPRAVLCNVMMDHPPWSNVGLNRLFVLQTQWQKFEEVFESTIAEPAAQIRFDLGSSDADVEFAEVSLERISDTAQSAGAVRRPWYVDLVGAVVVAGLGVLAAARFRRPRMRSLPNRAAVRSAEPGAAALPDPATAGRS